MKKRVKTKVFSNRTLYTFIALGIVLIIAGGVYATLGTVPNPGHAVSELQPCSNGEILKTTGGVWACTTEADPKVGTLGTSTNGKWCTSDGTKIVCTSNTPSSTSNQWTVAGSNLYYKNGYVGIGTTTPSQKLEVSGNLKVSTYEDCETSSVFLGYADPYDCNDDPTGCPIYSEPVTVCGTHGGEIVANSLAASSITSPNPIIAPNILSRSDPLCAITTTGSSFRGLVVPCTCGTFMYPACDGTCGSTSPLTNCPVVVTSENPHSCGYTSSATYYTYTCGGSAYASCGLSSTTCAPQNYNKICDVVPGSTTTCSCGSVGGIANTCSFIGYTTR